MDVLLSKLSYRLYEMESHCLSYDAFPVDSLIDIREGLVWLKSALNNFSDSPSLLNLFGQIAGVIFHLQQQHSPFLSSHREILIEFIDLMRQLVLEQSFNGLAAVNLVSKQERIDQLVARVEQGKVALNSHSSTLNLFEAKLEQDEESWLLMLLDFIEHFSRIGEFSVEGGLSFKFEDGLEKDAGLHTSSLVNVLKIHVKTSQSLAWMNRHYGQFNWELTTFTCDGAVDLAPIFRSIRVARSQAKLHYQKGSDLALANTSLEAIYKSTQLITLKELSQTLGWRFAIPFTCSPLQEKHLVNRLGLDDFYKEVGRAASSLNLSDTHNIFLQLQDVAGASYIYLYAGRGLSNDPIGSVSLTKNYEPFFESSLALNLAEQNLMLASFGRERICVPHSKLHSLLHWGDVSSFEQEADGQLNCLINGIGQICVFTDTEENLNLHHNKRIILVNDFDTSYGLLVDDVKLDNRGYKTQSFGLPSKAGMLWRVNKLDYAVEINPLLLSGEVISDGSQQSDISLDLEDGWLTKIAEKHVFIRSNVVAKHLAANQFDTIELKCIDVSLINIEECCYPFLNFATSPALSFILLTNQNQSFCLSVNSTYYKKSLDISSVKTDNSKRLMMSDFAKELTTSNEECLYVIDDLSFR